MGVGSAGRDCFWRQLVPGSPCCRAGPPDWLPPVPSREPDDETKYPMSLSFAVNVASLGGGAPCFSPRCHGEPGELWRQGSSHVGHGSPFWVLKRATLGRWDERRGPGLAPGDTHTPGRSSWGEMPTSLEPEGRGGGEGASGPGPPHTVAFSLWKQMRLGFRQSPGRRHAGSSLRSPSTQILPAGAARDRRTSRPGTP